MTEEKKTIITFYRTVESKMLIDKCPICGEDLPLLSWDRYEQKKYCDKCELIYDFSELYKDGMRNPDKELE